MKVFISQPFYGKSEEEIMAEREDILRQFKEFVRWPDEVPIEVIDNFHKSDAPENAGRLWYLGQSISQMDQADAIIFSAGARNASGCIVEECAATLYKKPTFYC